MAFKLQEEKYSAKLQTTILFVSLFVLTPSAFAQAEGFKGFAIEAATGYQEMTLKVRDVKINNMSLSWAQQDQRIEGTPYALNVGYSLAVGEAAGLGVRVEYNPKSSRVALALIPSYALTQNVQAYAKLGWAYMATTIETSIPGVALNAQTAYFNGPFFGVGAKLLLTDKLYLYAELNYYQYADLTLTAKAGPATLSVNVSSSAQNALFGLGYRF